ncbi:amidase [Bradyrhizobium jicamae]|uniref:amidase n=1 Tax=Bradyrhizobium jicamae TaxID=280332 RepID=UPI001BAB849B|nr:amidase [Bradyrhizobium jicamae]MBR0936050.1 amidase [Bradyrhizobium jicamae]
MTQSPTQDILNLYTTTDAVGLAQHVKKRDVTAAELVEAAVSVIERVDPSINSVAIKSYDSARECAHGVGERGVLAGVPLLLKNVGSACNGLPLDLGLKALQGRNWSKETEMVRRIRSAALSIIGRSNAPECGWSLGTENRLYGTTRNPHDTSRTAGGSSGGAAAAVAARLVPLAEASDGAGSIRVPASCCGVVGLKPARGRITYGPEGVDNWFGCVSTLCNSLTVRDTAAFLDVTAGNMPGDPYVPQRSAKSWLSLLDQPPRSLRIGYVMVAPWGGSLDPEVCASFEDNLRLLESFGHRLEEHRVATDLEAAWWRYSDIVSVEYAREFEDLGGMIGRPLKEDDFCPFNWAMVQHAKSLSAGAYSASIAAIRKAGQQLAIELSAYDVLVTPTLTQLPRPVNYWSMEERDWRTYLARWSDAVYMFAFNISGHPAISVPGKPSTSGLPIGIQYVGARSDEATLLQLARQTEVAAPWIGHIPGVSALTRASAVSLQAPRSEAAGTQRPL